MGLTVVPFRCLIKVDVSIENFTLPAEVRASKLLYFSRVHFGMHAAWPTSLLVKKSTSCKLIMFSNYEILHSKQNLSHS